MADSAFWRDLANQFRALPTECKMLRADRYPVDDVTDELSHWQLTGTATAKALVDALARRAASEIQDPASADLLAAWLEALIKRGGVQFHSQTITRGNNPDGTARPQQTIGTLYQLSEHSANYCHTLESAAVQAEFEEKQRNDPKSWPYVRQRYEAFKQIKNVISQPRETVPEAFLRNALSEQYGVKPEEVSKKQIQLGLADLGRYYPAISLVPAELTQPEQSEQSLGETETTQPVANSRLDPKALRDSYFANFPNEKIKIRDLCWAVRQHRREWTRWLAEKLKDGSTPDLAFRRILTSGKRPREFDKTPRPKGWE